MHPGSGSRLMANVLVVDPYQPDRVLLANLVRQNGHAVTEAADGESALALARSGHPDLVITEALMPGIDGYELVRRLRADPAVGPLTVIFATAPYLMDEVRPVAGACGVGDVVARPGGDPELLLAAVEAALGHGDRAPVPAGPAVASGPAHMEGVWAKLADRVRALEATQDALAESEGRFRLLAEYAPVGIMADDPAAGRYANRRYAEICGLSGDALLTHSPRDLIHPDDLPRVLEAVREAGGSGGRFRARIVRPDGDVRCVDVEWAPAGAARDPALNIVLVQDVTEVVNAAELKEALDQRLRSSERLEGLGQLAGGIAHDFNNLLAVILNYAQFVDDALAVAEPGSIPLAQVRDDLDELGVAARRAADLTHQLLVFDRREVGRPEIIDPGAAVERLGKSLRPTLGAHVSLEVRAEDGLPALHVDRSRFDQVVANLVANAIDSLEGSGSVTVSLDEVAPDEAEIDRLGLAAGRRHVRLAVTDDGAGMSAETLARACEPFFTTKDPGRGTGLGLATVYGIVRQWGGSLEIDSEPGRGTTVWVFVPVADTSEGTGPSKAEPPAPGRGRGEVVLVVEDDAAVLATARRILEAGGYAVVPESSPAAALELLPSLQPPPAVLLSDIVMPEMSGVELARRALQVQPGLGLVLMSGYPAGLMAHPEAIPAGTTVVDKPFTTSSLLAAVGAAALGRATTVGGADARATP